MNGGGYVVVDDGTCDLLASFDTMNEAREALARAGYSQVRYNGQESWTWRRMVGERMEHVHVDDREHYLGEREARRGAEATGGPER